ncbi:uncharacterized protein LOC123511578 isoform X3 [Portunus trituberculatus]|uniref:uncharacterized protein LOC123511578 isoform X3 n=1 Tax=Portunus trituberculatus TaxID=210409 RepID=UPI001E1CF3FB|nr:uncharacterized protein LOC123511578 isoform X3 [Portunus trituberculatus]XP_045123535.1 uncharacterized protein LOC123511578 isoform X3 [Portunus trituberculatus]
MARVDERKKEEDEEERKNESGRGGGAKTQYSGATIETEGIQRQCRKRNTELAGLQEAQSRREAGELEKNLADDSGLLKVLLDHLSEAEKDNLLLLQYSAEDTSKIKETESFCLPLCLRQRRTTCCCFSTLQRILQRSRV